MNKPCITCTRVTDPANCENKDCRLWQRWYVETWNQMRAAPRLDREQRPKETEGIVIGGVRYALPHRVDGYLQRDPCKGCLCPRDLCVIPCRIKRDWASARELVQ